MRISTTYLLPLLCGTLFWAACTKEQDNNVSPGGKPGSETSVSVRLNVVSLSPGDPVTRSITDADEVNEGLVASPKNAWVFQYDENDVLVGQPRYLDFEAGASTTQIPVIHSGTAVHTLFFLVNSHDANLVPEIGDLKTLALLLSKTQAVDRETDCYVQGLSGNDLLFNGYYRGQLGAGPIEIDLYRNIVKLTFQLENDANSGLTVETVQVFNVPSAIWYADRLCPAADGRFPAAHTTGYFDYPPEPIAIQPGDPAKSISWYLPRNEQGTVANADSRKKNSFAPSESTFVRIIARDTEGGATAFTFYPGANLVNDFNLSANKQYTIRIQINSKGDVSTDQRIQHYDPQDFASANSFILNPSPAGSKKRVFSFPVDRVNEFWDTYGYGPENRIEAETPWVATLIWQDVNDGQFIRFVDEAGTEQVRLNGVGPDQRIYVTTNGQHPGNALIGIRKANEHGDPIGDRFLWSWHLWVTDYDPDYGARIHTPATGQTIYRIPSTTTDAVHRYAGTDWAGTPYADKFIMDRNLGAVRAADNGSVAKGKLYYQFGRKDPFPAAVQLYDITGTLIWFTPSYEEDPVGKISGAVAFGEAVAAPTVFRTIGNGDTWTTTENENSWYHPVSTTGKSLFDPCPPNWKLPGSGVWEDFAYYNSDPANSTFLHPGRPEIGAWQEGTHYWPAGTAHSDVLSIPYPASGRRQPNGTIATDGVSLYWSQDQLPTGQAIGLQFSRTALNNPVIGQKSAGAAVRCIRE